MTSPAESLFSIFLSVGLLTAVTAQAATSQTNSIADLSLEELSNIRVTSVSKRSELLADAPASIFVISGDDIRRSSATTLPEALRLAPNLQVARVDARNYAVSARGFNGVFANKLLVLIDGRTVYTPLFSGVFWDAQDVVLEDVARIEVISGPGATLWGSNAVNGVINIITKSAADTQGTLAAVGGGNTERNGTVRYGGALDNGGHYRVYGKYIESDDTHRANGARTYTGWRRRQAGFRTDSGSSAQNFTLQGDAYAGALQQAGTKDIVIEGANLLARMNRKLDGGSNLSFQAYWDYTKRDQPAAFREELHAIDLQIQHSVRLAERHDIVWGAGYRVAEDRVTNQGFTFLPEDFRMYWGNVFVQDEIGLTDKLRLTIGAKLESNHYTGTEFLPTLRMAWNVAKDNLLWASASRAVRSPSRFDRDLFIPFATAGGPNFESEVANVAELGYRVQPTPTSSFSATMFYARYDGLRTIEPGVTFLPAQFANQAEGTTRGVEMWGNWQATSAWRLAAGFVAQKVKRTLDPTSRDLTETFGLGNRDASNFWQLRSSYDIAHNQELDVTIRHSGKLARSAAPAYTATDVRYGWKVRPDLELSIIGQNLFDSHHPEWGTAPLRSEFERSIFVKAVWRM